VRRGEEPRAAAAREIGEELGLAVGAEDLACLGAMRLDLGRRSATVSYFGLELAERTVEPDPVELAEVAWFGAGRLPRPLGEHVGEVLERHPLASVGTNPGSPDRG
jgi:8-oxo-dGTP pyrophosphatase MutT (NUDIX family)